MDQDKAPASQSRVGVNPHGRLTKPQRDLLAVLSQAAKRPTGAERWLTGPEVLTDLGDDAALAGVHITAASLSRRGLVVKGRQAGLVAYRISAEGEQALAAVAVPA